MPYSEADLQAIRAEYAKGATEDQFKNFIRECETRNLIPGRHVYFQLRKQSSKDSEGNWVKDFRPIHISSIDALRLIAQRTGEYQGQIEPIFIYLDAEGYPSIKSSIMLADGDNHDMPAKPYAVQVSVFRKGFQRPLTATARFEAYAQTKFGGGYTDMWDRRGPEQLAKCAEALALRQAFPEEIGGLYLAEELKDEPETQDVKEAATKKNVPEVKNERPRSNNDNTTVISDPIPERIITTKEDIMAWAKKLKALGVEKSKLLAYVERKYKVAKTTDLTHEQLAEIVSKCMEERQKGLDALNAMLDG